MLLLSRQDIADQPTATPNHRAWWRLWSASALLALGLIIVVALLTRLALLDAQSGWLDEGYSLAVARRPLGALIRFTAQYDTHPPLYYILLHLWAGIAGTVLLAARLLSLVCGAGSVAALYMVAGRLFDRSTALRAALLLAISPLACWYADEARMYAAAGMLALLAIAALLRAAIDPRCWPLYIGTGALALYTDYSAAYLLIGATLGYPLLVGTGRATLRPWLLSAAALGALGLPCLALLVWQTRNLASIGFIPAPTPGIVGATLLELLGQHSALPQLVAMAGLALAALGLLAAWRDRQAPRARRAYLYLAILVLTPLAIPLAISVAHPVFLTRTAMMAIYGLLILFARGSMVAKPRRELATLLPLLLLDAQALHTVSTTTINDDWRGAARYLHSTALLGDVLVFQPGYLQLPFALYGGTSDLRLAERGYPYDEGLLHESPRDLSSKRALAAATAGATNVWLVGVGGGGGGTASVTAATLSNGQRVPVGTEALHQILITRVLRPALARQPLATDWLTAAAMVPRQTRADDLVVLSGSGSAVFAQAWNRAPPVAARLLPLATPTAGALGRATGPGTRVIWLVAATPRGGDPAGIAANWLYHHGPQLGTARTIGALRLYRFRYGWNGKR